MRGRRIIGAAVTVAFVAGCGGGSVDDAATAPGSPPEEDPAQPETEDGTDMGVPGSLESSLPLPPELVPTGGVGWQVSYWTTGVGGDAVLVDGVVFAPAAGGVENRPVISWGHAGTDDDSGVADRCAPTRQGAVDVPYAETLLAEGYVIAATDYERPRDGVLPYFAVKGLAPAVIDIAVAAGEIPGPGAGTRVVFAGSAQGGAAALHAALMVGERAPALDVRGVVTATPAAEVAILMGGATGSDDRIFSYAMATAGFAQVYDELDLADLFTAEGLERAEVVTEECRAGVEAAFDGATTEDLLTSTHDDHPAWQARFTEHSVGAVDIGVPVLVLHGADDEVILPVASEIAVQRLCEGGTTVDHRVLEGVGHDDLLAHAANDVFTWLEERGQGDPAPSSC